MYSLEDLTEAEIKAIELITNKINYDDADTLNKVCSHLENQRLITSKAGKAYLAALRNMNTQQGEVTRCIYCDSILNKKEHIICSSCLAKILKKPKSLVSGKSYILPIIMVIAAVILLSGAYIIENNYLNTTKKTLIEQSEVIDGIDFLGKTKDTTDSLFGESTSIIMDNALYYPNSGVSIVYDANTNIINYIDCDNTGAFGSIEIMGVNVGWSKNDLILYFQNMGYDCNIADNNTLTVHTPYNGNTVEIYIVLDNDIVTLVCASII